VLDDDDNDSGFLAVKKWRKEWASEMENISNEALNLFVFYANLLAKNSHKFPCLSLVKMEKN